MKVASRGMTFEKTQSAGYLANHLARLFAKALQAEIKPLGLAPAQFMTLLELWGAEAACRAAGEEPPGLTQRELVARLDVEQATMANTLTRMERDGLIRRTPHPEDGRSQLVRLTEKGAALEAPATEAAKRVNQQALSGLSAERRDALLQDMRAMMAALGGR